VRLCMWPFQRIRPLSPFFSFKSYSHVLGYSAFTRAVASQQGSAFRVFHRRRGGTHGFVAEGYRFPRSFFSFSSRIFRSFSWLFLSNRRSFMVLQVKNFASRCMLESVQCFITFRVPISPRPPFSTPPLEDNFDNPPASYFFRY